MTPALKLIDLFYKDALDIEQGESITTVFVPEMSLCFQVLKGFDPVKVVKDRSLPALEDIANILCSGSKDASLKDFLLYSSGFLDYAANRHFPRVPMNGLEDALARGLLLSHLCGDATQREKLLTDFISVCSPVDYHTPDYEQMLHSQLNRMSAHPGESQKPTLTSKESAPGSRSNIDRSSPFFEEYYNTGIYMILPKEVQDATAIRTLPLIDHSDRLDVSIQ